MDNRYDFIDRYIYALVDPRENIKIAYIGQSYNPQERYKAHLRDVRNENCKNIRKKDWLRELLGLNLKPELVIVRKTRGCLFMVFKSEVAVTLKFMGSGYKIMSVRKDKLHSLLMVKYGASIFSR